MPFVGKYHVTATLCLLALIFQPCTSAGTKTSSTAVGPSTSTCPSRTINYITETLPQQCLRTDWSSNITATEFKNTSEHTAAEAGLITVEQPLPASVYNTTETAENTIESTASISDPKNETVSSDDGAASTQTPAEATPAAEPPSSNEPDSEADPLSDHANFLSFEDWKSQMLQKAGQSAENIGGARQGDTNPESRRRTAGVQQALDSLGDDNEIELDFPGFVNSESMPEAVPPPRDNDKAKEQAADNTPDASASPRSKEAGTTSKERFNYASFDCAATVLKKNNECKGPNSILLENKDSYMLNPCKAKNKFFIVELCNDILIDTIALGNYEFFSSTFRTFRVSISDRYPVKADKWREIGTFEAQNTRGVQAFLVENGLIWARYLRIEFLTHYGNEYYCPISILRVHGKTMIDDYRNDMKAARGEDDIEDDTSEIELGQVDAEVERIAPIVTESSVPSTQAQNTDEAEHSSTSAVASSGSEGHGSPNEFKDKCPRTNYVSPLVQQVDLVTSNCPSSRKYCNLELTPRINATARSFSTQNSRVADASSAPAATNATVEATEHSVTSTSTRHSSNTTQATQDSSGEKPSANSTESTPARHDENPTSSTSVTGASSTSTTASSRSASQPPAASPSTQESFFKSVHKRLQLLEANSTLSLQYIEEQSRILREAFTKVEKRQLNKTTTFLESLNTTVLGELREFRLQYDQIWQSTILELSSQREQSQREAVALTTRMTLLADEVLWQKRLVYLQFGLILLCLGLIMFSRNNATPYLELPAFQNIVQRSSTGFSRQLGLESPPGTPSRPNSRYGLFSRRLSHFRNASDVSGKSPSTGDQSPTPPTEDESELRRVESPEPAEPMIRRAISSPALGQDAVEVDSDEDAEANNVSLETRSGGDSTGLDERLMKDEGHTTLHVDAGMSSEAQTPYKQERKARFAPPTPD